ncbi:MAG: isoprenylcysteine carboxylmethyltransferase family protein [Kordiimonas sp.]
MANIDMLTLYGPAALIVFITVWGLARILYLWKAEDVSVLTILKQKKTPAERLLSLTALLLDGYLLSRPFIPELDELAYAYPSPAPLVGLTITVIGLLIVVVCQFTMGKAWRIGVPSEKERSQKLIKEGLYAYSRNPIYVGVLLFVAGCFLTVPGPIPGISLLLTLWFLRAIIKREEAFMTASFGKDYDAYCHEVRRWL